MAGACGGEGGKDCPRGFGPATRRRQWVPNVEPWNCGNAVSASARQDELKQADGSKPRINRGFAAAIRSINLLYTMLLGCAYPPGTLHSRLKRSRVMGDEEGECYFR